MLLLLFMSMMLFSWVTMLEKLKKLKTVYKNNSVSKISCISNTSWESKLLGLKKDSWLVKGHSYDFHVQDCHPSAFPMEHNIKIEKEDASPEVDAFK